MNLTTIVIIAVGLATDVFAVSVSVGCINRKELIESSREMEEFGF